MQTPGSQFLHDRDPNFHSSKEVETVVSYLRASGEAIPNEPADKISSYLGFLANQEYVNDGILTGNQQSIDRQIEAHVIKATDVPESYFKLQQRIAREQGHGDITITREMRNQMIEAVQVDQRVGLGKWVEYLGGEDGGYPDWFKHYAFGSVTKLGGYDKDRGEFLMRSKGTTATYPELNREALAYVYDVLSKSKIQGQKVDGGANNEKLQKLLESANFGKLYAHAVLEVSPTSPELLKEVRGTWTKFNQSTDPRTARRLSGSLQGHGTGWCTAGDSTASNQLQGGDFYVYYTRDEDGKDTVPRVAIRMQNGEVAEVRGIGTAQELEPAMANITAERLQDLPGGDVYIRKAEDMKRLTDIDNRITDDPEAKLTKDEVKFLYELSGAIEGFGYDRDPRIDAIRAKRGNLDHAELKVLAVEHLQESFLSMHAGYSTVVGAINGLNPKGERISTLSESELANWYDAKMIEWQKAGVLDYIAERIISDGVIYTPVVTPNNLISAKQLKEVAKLFGKGQPYGTYICDELYDQYSAEEISGRLVQDAPVRFSLIPSKHTTELGSKTAQDQKDILDAMQSKQPGLNLHVPSVLDAVTLWYTLRAQGNKLTGNTVWEQTGIRHFDLEPKRLGRWLRLPRSVVRVDGQPFLDFSLADSGYDARVAVG